MLSDTLSPRRVALNFDQCVSLGRAGRHWVRLTLQRRVQVWRHVYYLTLLLQDHHNKLWCA